VPRPQYRHTVAPPFPAVGVAASVSRNSIAPPSGELGQGLRPPEVGQKPLLDRRVRIGDHLGPIVAKVSVGPDQAPGRNETHPPEFIPRFKPSVVDWGDIPPVREDIDQVDARGLLSIEVAERQVAHSGAVCRNPGLLSSCQSSAERTRRVDSDEVAPREFWSVSLA